MKIAVALPHTGEDLVSGRELSHGVELAKIGFRELDLLPHGYRLTVETFDDKSTEAGARSAALQIVSDPHVVAVVGHFSSANTLAALPTYETAGLPVIMPIATLTSITEEFSNVFRLPPSNERQAQTVVAFAADYLAGEQLFLVHDTTEYGADLEASIDAGLRNRRLQPIGSHPIPRGTKNFPFLAGLGNYNPPLNVIIFAGYSPEAVYFAKQLQLNEEIAAELVSTDGVYGTRFRTAEGSEGTYVVYQVPPLSILQERDAWKEYARAFEERYPNENSEGWAAWSYDAVRLAREAIRQSLYISRIPSAHKVLAVLEGKVDETPFTFSGVLSDYEFTERGENIHGHYYVYQVQKSEYVVLPWSPGRERNPGLSDEESGAP